MASEALLKFAEELRLAREAKGLSILQISSRTKIDPKFLSAIENGDFEILPELYVRAFIKEFAQTIDLNPKETIQKFDYAKTGQQEKALVTKEQISKPVVNETTKPHEELIPEKIISSPTTQFDSVQDSSAPAATEAPKSFIATNLNIIMGAAVLIVAALVFYFAFFYESSPEIIADLSEQNSSETASRFEVKQPEQLPVQDTIPAPVVSDSLRLSVQNSGQVWIKVLCDGKIKQQGILKNSGEIKFKALKQFGISIGNAGLVKLFLNEKPVNNVGKLGEIRNITITPDTIRYLTIPRNEKKSP
ncbi:MAG: helix-turn-helix domain-containing protein [Melioribacteraceae bacterium]